MEQEADTEFYQGYRIEKEDYTANGMTSVTATRVGATTLSGIGKDFEAAIDDAKKRIDAMLGKNLGS